MEYAIGGAVVWILASVFITMIMVDTSPYKIWATIMICALWPIWLVLWGAESVWKIIRGNT